MAKKKRTPKKKDWKQKWPPLVPHFETNDYGRGVTVMRIPPNADPVDLQIARQEQIKISKQHSPQDPDWY